MVDLEKLHLLPFVTLLLVIMSCSDNDTIEEDVDENISFVFEDGFSNTGSLFDLFPDDGSRWTNIQQVDPEGGTNQLSITESGLDGDGLSILAAPSDDVLSKMDIEKSGFNAPAGSTVTIEADIYIENSESLQDLLLIDLECCACWDPTVENNQCPGVRLMMSGGNDFLSIERGKILGTTLTQTQFAFPRKEWVHISWQMTLSDDDDGTNMLYINDQLVLSETGMNLPNADQFRDEFAQYDINFELQEPLYYERVQIGATANPTEHTIEMYIDNFRLEIVEG